MLTVFLTTANCICWWQQPCPAAPSQIELYVSDLRGQCGVVHEKEAFVCRVLVTEPLLFFPVSFFIFKSSSMVKVLALSVFHKTPAATTELASAFDLSQFGFFQRGTIQVQALIAISYVFFCAVYGCLKLLSACARSPSAAGIHEVFLKNMRSKEHKSNGSGTCPICTSTPHVIAIDLTFLQLEHTQDSQKVMCFVVASQSGPAVAVRSAQSLARV
jgi:hypothetical protein